jgi:hypothetical protein
MIAALTALETIDIDDSPIYHDRIPLQSCRLTGAETMPKHRQQQRQIAFSMPTSTASRLNHRFDLSQGQVLATAIKFILLALQHQPPFGL